MLKSGDQAAPGPMPIKEACTATQGHGDIQAQTATDSMSVSVVLLQLESVLMSVACITTKAHVNQML